MQSIMFTDPAHMRFHSSAQDCAAWCSQCMLSDARMYRRPPLGDDGVYPCGRFAFAKYIQGNSAPHSPALLSQGFSGGGGGWWWVDGYHSQMASIGF